MTENLRPAPRPLGGLDPAEFLRTYWHKQPLLIRGAVPDILGRLSPHRLMALACRDDVESRLVRSSRGRWQLEHGPFDLQRLTRLPARGWSLLVSGVDHHLPYAARLLQRFDFVPYARLDDVMVSLAPPGGGVGPHFDSYDVFLIQGLGSRRWEIAAQDDLELVEDAPLRILKRFTPQQSWVLEPGDMLYLPPRYAHNGVALTPCMTWSVGFRAPSHQEIAAAFLDHLHDRLDLDGRYADPDLSVPSHPAELPAAMIERLGRVIAGIRWQRRDVIDFLGLYLSEPKPQVFFRPPRRPLSLQRFAERARTKGVSLDARTRLLFHGRTFYINGERVPAGPGQYRTLVALADARRLGPQALPAGVLPLLHAWYQQGYLHIG
ncbi:MAG: cupin domain-containing protein [Thiobacillaceae bacterium]|nr:cupin domain-containing protein [Thiobacillaceae bacterium]MDW8324064.1 cupin domain-containing protein [Burkholderiales bacterium]